LIPIDVQTLPPQAILLFTEDILEINQSETKITCGGHVS
jgi:hypothetical protein